MQMDLILFNDTGQFDEVHNSIIDIFTLYQTRRLALTDAVPGAMKRMADLVNLREDEKKQLIPRSIELNALVEQMLLRTDRDSQQAWKVIDRFSNSLNKEFRLQLEVRKGGVAPKPSTEEVEPRGWHAALLKTKKRRYLGRFEAPDRKSAETAVIRKFNLTDEQRKWLVLQEER
jgi:hypothetical protein